MKLKKLFSVALSVLLIVALAGCGGTKDEIASTSDKTTETGASELLSLYDSISTEKNMWLCPTSLRSPRRNHTPSGSQ